MGTQTLRDGAWLLSVVRKAGLSRGKQGDHLQQTETAVAGALLREMSTCWGHKAAVGMGDRPWGGFPVPGA